MTGLFKPWPDDVKDRALVLAGSLGTAEASARTGVPEGTIRSWRQQLPSAASSAVETGAETDTVAAVPAERTRPALKQAVADIFEQARQEVKPHVVKRLAERADDLLELNRQSTREWLRVLALMSKMVDSGKAPPPALVRMFRALIGSAKQAADQLHLVCGVPARVEVGGKITRRNEFVGVVIDATRAREHVNSKLDQLGRDVRGRVDELAARDRALEGDSGDHRDN